MMGAEVRVINYYATEDAEGIRLAYDQVSKLLAAVPGMLGNELIHSVHDPLGWIVISRWTDLAAFTAWEAGAEHRADTTPLRPYQDRRRGLPFGIYELSDSY